LALSLGQKTKRFVDELLRDKITFDTAPAYHFKGLLCSTGLCVVWGPPKCGKSFLVFNLVMHVAPGWPCRGRRVKKGNGVYCALEGGAAFKNRIEGRRTHGGSPVSRKRLPNRRQCESFDVRNNGLALTLCAWFNSDGRLAEIFISSHKPGSPIEATARDAAVTLSIALQFGANLETIRKALTKDHDGGPATAIRAALDAFVEQRR
jgi:hypothetical protein